MEQPRLPSHTTYVATRRNIARDATVSSKLDLSSDHSPIVATINSTFIEKNPPISISNKYTNWAHFRESFNISTTAALSLKTSDDVDQAIKKLTHNILEAVRASTPNYSLWKATKRFTRPTQDIPPLRKSQGEWVLRLLIRKNISPISIDKKDQLILEAEMPKLILLDNREERVPLYTDLKVSGNAFEIDKSSLNKLPL
ncbi:hypothetical protein M0802_009217 [Mischocyttarus mexicanus]|nr:hypothetical protein M0802_009217 [Mischocyttarus mexicanus]